MKLRMRFLQLPVLFDAASLAAEVSALPADAWLAHPQGFAGNDAVALIGVGGDPANDATSGPMLPTPYLLACPYLMQVLDTLGATWGRTRLMRLSGQAEVNAHVDTDYYWREHMRVHVPIVTQPTVRFDCGDESVHMAAGECWIFDTWSLHRVINDAVEARIHLVADTVGGPRLLSLIERGRDPARPDPGWAAQPVAPSDAPAPQLDYESANSPKVMGPWELRDAVSFLLGDLKPHPRLRPVAEHLHRFIVAWHALWACYGEADAGRERYEALLDQTWRQLEVLGGGELVLNNGMPLGGTLYKLVFGAALAGRAAAPMGESRDAPGAKAPRRPSAGRDDRFDRPVFIVSSPRSGSTLLFETLAGAPGLYTTGGESHGLIEGIAAFNVATRGFSSNRLTAEDAEPAAVAELRERFSTSLADRDGAPAPGGRVRMLEKTPKNALRIPLLMEAFPEARFVYLHRSPEETLASMIDAWSSGRFRTYPNLPGWTGPKWSLLLTPGWRALIGKPLAEIVARQWATATHILLDELEKLPADRWTVARYDALTASPQTEISRLCAALDLAWDRPLGGDLPLSVHTLTPPDPDKWRRHEAAIEAVRPMFAREAMRAAAFAERT
jgi:sulfotransferase family protein/aspartyl/asparaginyl beta-hydroxylase